MGLRDGLTNDLKVRPLLNWVMRFSLIEKRILKLMIVDCEYHHMTEKEA
jgi:hypothetical protein